MRYDKIVIIFLAIISTLSVNGMYLPAYRSAAQKSLQMRRSLPLRSSLNNTITPQVRYTSETSGLKPKESWASLLKRTVMEEPAVAYPQTTKHFVPYSEEEMVYDEITSIPPIKELEQKQKICAQELEKVQQKYIEWYNWAKNKYEEEKAQNDKSWWRRFIPAASYFSDFHERDSLEKVKVTELENECRLLHVFLDKRDPFLTQEQVRQLKSQWNDLRVELAHLRREYAILPPETTAAKLKLSKIANTINRLQVIDVRLLKKEQNDTSKEFIKHLRPAHKKLKIKAKE
jgi:hypothetical protein